MALPSCEKCGDAADVVRDGKRWRCNYKRCDHGLDRDGSVIPACRKCGDYQDVEVTASQQWRCTHDKINIGEDGHEIGSETEGLLPSEASVHEHGGNRCLGGPYNRATSEFVYYMAHMENAARIINWGLYAHHWAQSLPGRRVIANSSVMRRFGRREHRKFANLYFGTHTAMQYVLTQGNSIVLDEKDMVFLRFNSDDLFLTNGAKFSDGNVARSETTVYSADEDSMELEGLAWNIILCQKNRYLGENLKRLKMAELLVPHYIPPSHIHSAVVLNSESEEKLRSLMEGEHPEGYTEALDEIINDSDFDPPFDEDDIALEPNYEVDIIRDGKSRHFFGYGDGDGGYNDGFIPDPDDW